MGLEDKTNFPIGVSATFQGLLLLNFKWVTRWWQLKDFWNFHEFSPQKIGGKKTIWRLAHIFQLGTVGPQKPWRFYALNIWVKKWSKGAFLWYIYTVYAMYIYVYLFLHYIAPNFHCQVRMLSQPDAYHIVFILSRWKCFRISRREVKWFQLPLPRCPSRIEMRGVFLGAGNQ